ncbi:MAG: heavy-metal-associated domain-containing protein [Deltaproteobacteria bacterium]|nr:heavy-metal-associated domain-containing protein [Deltaproteobacteria bacterium]
MKKTQLLWRSGRLILTLGAAIMLTLAACSGKSAQEQIAEKALEKATGHKADVDLQQGKVTVKTGDGQSEISFGQEGSWPKDLPADVPAFAQGKIKGVTRSTQGGKQSWNVVLEAIETGSLQNYGKKLEAAGWKSLSTISTAEGGMIQATKGKLLIMAMFNEKEKSGGISISTQD